MIRGGYDDFETPYGITNPSGQGFTSPFATSSYGGGFLSPEEVGGGGGGLITYPGQQPGFVPSQFGGPGNSSPPQTFNLAPTGAQVAANPGAYAGTSFDPTRSALQGNNVPYDPNWQSLLTPWNTTNPTQANDPLAWVRNLDQATYYKYILPYQQNGGDITNINAMTRAIQEGMARDGGGQWANGSTVNSVQGPRLSWMQSPTGNAGNAPAGVSQQQTPVIGSTNNLTTGNSLPSGLSAPHQTFLQSNDPRAVYLRNLLSSGNAAEQNAARTWMHQNIVPGGTAGRPLDNINDWTSRFRNFFNLSGPGGTGGAGTPSTPAGGGGGGIESWLNSGAPGAGQDYSDWYYSNMGPGYVNTDQTGDVQYYQQWSDEIDRMIMQSGLLGGQFRNPTQAQLQNDNYLQQLRQALDRARAENGFQSYADVARLATGSGGTSNTDWFAEQGDLAAAPFKPNEDPGQGFQWDWVPGSANSPGRWYRRAKAANSYQDYVNQVTKANEFRAAGNKIPILGQAMLGLFGQGEQLDPFGVKNGQYTPLAEAIFNYNKGFQNSNQLLYDAGINSQFLNNYNGMSAADVYDEYNNDDVMRAMEELNALRQQPGYNRVGYMGNTKPVSDPSWFIGSAANTPYRPEEAPLEGFKWAFDDPDGAGPLTAKTWMMRQVFNPANMQEATDFANRINAYQNNPNANKLMFANNNGTPMFNFSQNNGQWNYSVNPNYPTWKPAPTPTSSSTPTIGNQFTMPSFTFPTAGGGGGSTSTGSGSGGGTNSSVSFTSPFGSMTGRPPRLGGGGSSFWG